MNLINPSHHQFLRLPLGRKFDFIRYLLAFNRNTGAQDRDGAAESTKNWMDVRRPYHQLPCSQETRKRRAHLFLDLGFQHKNVCLLGDDDGVAVELMALGFSSVTVYDCDRRVLDDIAAKIPDSSRSCIELKQLDFRLPVGMRRQFADLVCFDPPYHKEGMRIFMETALACSKRLQDSQLIMMTIPLLFQNQSADWASIESGLAAHGFQRTGYHQGFNAYPLDPLHRFLLFSVSHVFRRSEFSLRGMKELSFFSDCLIWEKQG